MQQLIIKLVESKLMVVPVITHQVDLRPINSDATKPQTVSTTNKQINKVSVKTLL